MSYQKLKQLLFEDVQLLQKKQFFYPEETGELQEETGVLIITNTKTKSVRYLELKDIPFKLKTTREILND